MVLTLHAPLNLSYAVLASDGLHWLLHATLTLGINLMVGLNCHELDTFSVKELATITNAPHSGHRFFTMATDLSVRLLLR